MRLRAYVWSPVWLFVMGTAATAYADPQSPLIAQPALAERADAVDTLSPAEVDESASPTPIPTPTLNTPPDLEPKNAEVVVPMPRLRFDDYGPRPEGAEGWAVSASTAWSARTWQPLSLVGHAHGRGLTRTIETPSTQMTEVIGRLDTPWLSLAGRIGTDSAVARDGAGQRALTVAMGLTGTLRNVSLVHSREDIQGGTVHQVNLDLAGPQSLPFERTAHFTELRYHLEADGHPIRGWLYMRYGRDRAPRNVSLGLDTSTMSALSSGATDYDAALTVDNEVILLGFALRTDGGQGPSPGQFRLWGGFDLGLGGGRYTLAQMASSDAPFDGGGLFALEAGVPLGLDYRINSWMQVGVSQDLRLRFSDAVGASERAQAMGDPSTEEPSLFLDQLDLVHEVRLNATVRF